jgi:hypothetical protein
MQMHDGIRLNGNPFPQLSTSVCQPKIVVVQNTNPISLRLLHAKIDLCRLGLEFETPFGSDVQFARKSAYYPPAGVARARVDSDHFDAFIVLVD